MSRIPIFLLFSRCLSSSSTTTLNEERATERATHEDQHILACQERDVRPRKGWIDAISWRTLSSSGSPSKTDLFVYWAALTALASSPDGRGDAIIVMSSTFVLIESRRSSAKLVSMIQACKSMVSAVPLPFLPLLQRFNRSRRATEVDRNRGLCGCCGGSSPEGVCA